MDLRERIMKNLSNADERFFDETVSHTLMDFYSENGEFTKDDLAIAREFNFGAYEVFLSIGRAYDSETFDTQLEFFENNGYIQD